MQCPATMTAMKSWGKLKTAARFVTEEAGKEDEGEKVEAPYSVLVEPDPMFRYKAHLTSNFRFQTFYTSVQRTFS